MEPKIEPEVSEYLTDPLALAVLFHATYERLAPNSGYETRKETRIFDPESSNGKLMLATCAQVQKAILSERVPSSPAPRLEFQADRMTETEWSADTWLVLPSGKREVLGWIPCDSQDDADREVATLKKLYAEAVPSSPAAPLEEYRSLHIVVRHQIKGENGFSIDVPAEHLDRVHQELLEYLRRLMITRGSPAALTPPPDSVCPTCGMDIRCVHGKLFAETCEPCEAPDDGYKGIPCTQCGSVANCEPGDAGYCEKHDGKECTSASPCGEIVAKGVCDIGPLAGNRVHEQDDYCLNWHATIRVCLGCGRKEAV